MTLSTSSAGCSRFPRFSELPVEVREMIWKLALRDARIVHLKQRLLKPHSTPGSSQFLDHDAIDAERAIALRWQVHGSQLGVVNMSTADEQNTKRRVELGEYYSDILDELVTAGRATISTPPSSRNYDPTPYSGEDLDALGEEPEGDYAFFKPIASTSFWGFYSTSRTPSVLLACKEARLIGIQRYQLVFSGPCNVTPQIYFDFRRDTLYLDKHMVRRSNGNMVSWLQECFNVNELRQVEILALGYGDCVDAEDRLKAWVESKVCPILTLFPAVKKVTFVTHHMHWPGIGGG